jgi:hypothetical protein
MTPAATGAELFGRRARAADGSVSYVYDAFGRQSTIPAADAPNSVNQAITLSYFDDDSVRSMTQGFRVGEELDWFCSNALSRGKVRALGAGSYIETR